MNLTIQNSETSPLFDVMAGQGHPNMGQPNHGFLKAFSDFAQNMHAISARASENSVANESVKDAVHVKNAQIHSMANPGTHEQRSENPWKLLSLFIDHYEASVKNDEENKGETQAGQKEQTPMTLVDFLNNLQNMASLEGTDTAGQDLLLQYGFIQPADMAAGEFSNQDVLDKLKFLVSSNITVGHGKNRETDLTDEKQTLPGHGKKVGSGNEIAAEGQTIGEEFVANSKIQVHGTANKEKISDKPMGLAGSGGNPPGQNRETGGVILAQGKNPDQGKNGKDQNHESGIALAQKAAIAATENTERAVDRPTKVGAYPLSDMGAGKDEKAIAPSSWMVSSAAEKPAHARDAATIDNGGDIENGEKTADERVTASTRSETQQEAFNKEGREKQDFQDRNLSLKVQDKTFRAPTFVEKAPVENQGDFSEPESTAIVKDIFNKREGLSVSRVSLKEDRPLTDAPTEKNHAIIVDSVKNEMSLEVTPKTDASVVGSGKPAPNAGVFQSHQGEKAVSDKNLLGQIVNKAVLELGKNKSEMKIDIKPENLGAVKIQVVSENQHIHAKITAENVAVKEIIEQNIEQLKQDLNKGGLAVDAVEVSVDQEKNPGGQESREEYARQLRNMARFRRNDLKFPDRSDAPGTRAHGHGDSGVDYYA